MDKKIIIFCLLLLSFVMNHTNCYCSNDRSISWSFTEESKIIAFKNESHILKWANSPYVNSYSELLSASDKKILVVTSTGHTSSCISAKYDVFIQQDSIYLLYAFTDNWVHVRGRDHFELVDGDVLVISDMEGQLGALSIDFDSMSDEKEIIFMDRYIQDNKEFIVASRELDNRRLRLPQPLFAAKDYDCVVKGVIEERVDLAYFDGGYFSNGGAISAIKVRIQKVFGPIEQSKYIWIYPDTTELGMKPLILHYGFGADSLGSLYFFITKKDDKYVYRLDGSIIRPDEDGSVTGYFNYIDVFYSLFVPKGRTLSSKTFERKLAKRCR